MVVLVVDVEAVVDDVVVVAVDVEAAVVVVMVVLAVNVEAVVDDAVVVVVDVDAVVDIDVEGRTHKLPGQGFPLRSLQSHNAGDNLSGLVLIAHGAPDFV